MVEIFSLGRGAGAAPTRTTGSEARLAAPSDVYFGAGAPGIAYFEKSGADLKVTLLDGTEVLIRDFFVIGESGDFSRLLTAAGGEVEVTGLIAPEPFLPRSEPTIAAAESQAGATVEEILPAGIDSPAAVAGGEAPVWIDPKAPTSIPGASLDFAVFGASLLVPAAVIIGSDSKSDGPAGDAPVSAPVVAAPEAAPGDEAQMDDETAALLTGIMDPDSAGPESAEASPAGPDFGAQGGEVTEVALSAGDFSFDSLFDALSAPGTQTG